MGPGVKMAEIGQAALRKLVKDLCDIEEGLTDWEVDFVESLGRDLALAEAEGYDLFLSPKRLEKALEIFEQRG